MYIKMHENDKSNNEIDLRKFREIFYYKTKKQNHK